MKKCSRCKNIKPFGEFSKDKTRKDGFQNKCKSCRAEHYAKNREQRAEYTATHKEEIAEYRATHKKEIAKQKAEYQATHKKEIAEYQAGYQAEYQRNRRAVDPKFKLIVNMRTRLYHALRNNQKTGRTLDLLGCSVAHLKRYLELQFKPDMSWGNWGKVWEIDHVVPLSYCLENEFWQRYLFNYKNLKPMYKEDNRSKKDTINWIRV